MEYNVLFTEHARDDLKRIHEYIAFELHSPRNASGITMGSLAASKGLTTFPRQNPVYHAEPWRGLQVRFLTYKKYIIFYKVNDEQQTVTVSRIMYGGRDIANQLEESDFE